MIDLKRLRYFCAIAEQGQISRAARVLNIAQPPLSQRLRELEEELGCALFERRGRSLVLTEAGRLLKLRAAEILRSVDAARAEVVRAAIQTGPALRLGLSPTCRNFWLARFSALRERFPERTIGVVVGDSSYLEQLLQTRQIDAALMQPPLHPENFTVLPLASSRTIAVAPPGLLPASPAEITLQELSRHPLLLLRRSVGIGSYEGLMHRFQLEGLSPRVALHSSDVELLLDLLGQGFTGIAVIPESESADIKPFDIRPIAVDLPDYRLSLVHRSSDPEPEVFAALCAVWRQE